MSDLHVCVLFYNIGGYHAARLRAAAAACESRGGRLTAIQMFGSVAEHPWGNLEEQITFPLITLQSASDSPLTPISRILDELQPNILVIPGWFEPAARDMLQWSRIHSVPAILMSESKRDDAPRQWWKEQVKSWRYIRHFSAAIVGGELHRQYAIELGIPPNKVFLGYNVVDNQYFADTSDHSRQEVVATRQCEPLIPVNDYFLTMTRFLPRKNVLAMIQAFASYREQLGTAAWDLVICGSGEQEDEIKALIQSLHLTGHVHLPGFVPYQSLGNWYGLAQALIHPALQEQWGLVLNEAAAAGLPILSSRTVGAARELVQDGESGILFDPEDVADITRAMLKFHQLTPEHRRAMRAASRQIVFRYGPEQFAAGLMNAIEAAS
ncbi:MAG: glycosyltransferase family 4 protein [Acidobacteria bacterium]|nr:glycosyltransferase family 4 protein [Acidobacteriota bacterium]